MTNEEIRIKIAETLGWTKVYKTSTKLVGKLPDSEIFQEIPNWPEYLDACQPLMNEVVASKYGNKIVFQQTKDGMIKECVITGFFGCDIGYEIGEDKRSYAKAFCLAYLRWKGVKVDD